VESPLELEEVSRREARENFKRAEPGVRGGSPIQKLGEVIDDGHVAGRVVDSRVWNPAKGSRSAPCGPAQSKT
jgi:hypothetical protein